MLQGLEIHHLIRAWVNSGGVKAPWETDLGVQGRRGGTVKTVSLYYSAKMCLSLWIVQTFLCHSCPEVDLWLCAGSSTVCGCRLEHSLAFSNVLTAELGFNTKLSEVLVIVPCFFPLPLLFFHFWALAYLSQYSYIPFTSPKHQFTGLSPHLKCIPKSIRRIIKRLSSRRQPGGGN